MTIAVLRSSVLGTGKRLSANLLNRIKATVGDYGKCLSCNVAKSFTLRSLYKVMIGFGRKGDRQLNIFGFDDPRRSFTFVEITELLYEHHRLLKLDGRDVPIACVTVSEDGYRATPSMSGYKPIRYLEDAGVESANFFVLPESAFFLFLETVVDNNRYLAEFKKRL